ncbi:MAG: hypothetical protein L6Q63_14155, partial [Giesbergeria sp.]|nr:hypothetical protein [Giesbergeria sp.]
MKKPPLSLQDAAVFLWVFSKCTKGAVSALCVDTRWRLAAPFWINWFQPITRGTCKIQNRNMAETLRCSIFEHFAVVRKNAQRYRIDSPVGDPQCSL